MCSESSAAGCLDPDDVAGREVARRLGGQLVAVQEVASRSAGLAALGSAWRVAPSFGDHGEAAGLEHAELPDYSVAALKAAGAA